MNSAQRTSTCTEDPPKKQGELTLFAEVDSGADICLDQVNTNNSIKEFFLPRCEKVFSFKTESKKVEIEDAAEADRLFSILMGDNVEKRRKYIETHALEVKNLDV